MILPQNDSAKNLLACAVDAVRVAGQHALDNIDRRTDAVEVSVHDVKLALDIECQAKAEAVIRGYFPDHSILGEEDAALDAAPGGSSEYEWVVDPIDGTVNFSHGMRRWACSIGVRRDGTTLAGAVYAPETDELYTATLDTAAQCNGKEIKVSQTNRAARSIVFTGLDKKVNASLPPFEIFRSIAANVQRPRVMGCASLDMCHVAAGYGDAYFESGIYIWDVIAAALIVTRAGGKAELLSEKDDGRLMFLASNGLVHEEMRELVAGGQ